VLNDVSQLLAAWPITRAVFMGLFTKGPHKFRVTAKGGDRTKTVVQWPLMKPFAVLFGLSLLGMILPLTVDSGFGHISRAGDGIRVVLFWTIYNLLVIAITMLACVERPRVNRPQRGTVERAHLSTGHRWITCWLLELGIDQARLRGADGLSVGDRGTVALQEIGDVSVTIVEKLHDGYRLRLHPTETQKIQILQKIHTADAVPGAAGGDLSGMVRGWMRVLSFNKNA
jgi:hypothetical protein